MAQGIENALVGHKIVSATRIDAEEGGYALIAMTFEDDVILRLQCHKDGGGIVATLLRPA